MLFCNVKHLIFILIIIPFCSFAQMLDNSKGFAFTQLPYFNEQFIKMNKIQSLNGFYQHKKLGDIIRKTDYIYQYKFDKEGRLIFSLETKLIGTIVDTLVLYYEYDADNRLSIVRQKDKDGFFSTKYNYDAKNRVIKEEYFRDIDTTTNNVSQPSFERSTYINSERYEYEENAALTKKIYYNNYDFPYLDEYITNNKFGLVEKKEKVIRTTSSVTTTTFEYNEKGWVSKKKVVSSSNKNLNTEIEFNYDAQGNLSDKQIYKNGEHITDIQLIYNSKTGILNYTLTRDVKTNFISILKFDKIVYY